MSKYGFADDDLPEEPAPATISLPKPKKKAADKPAPEALREAVRAGEALGFVSREPDAKPAARRPGRRKAAEPTDQLNIFGPVRVIQAFRDYCDREGLQNYWTGIERLLQQHRRSDDQTSRLD